MLLVSQITTSMSDLFTNVLVNLVKYFDGCRGFRHDAHRFLVLSFNSIGNYYARYSLFLMSSVLSTASLKERQYVSKWCFRK